MGDTIVVLWPVDNAYYPSFVAEEQNDNKTVVYDDGGIETLDFATETWQYASSAKLRDLSATSLTLKSGLNDVLMRMFNYFGNKPFMRHQAQGFPQYALKNAYDSKETDLKKLSQLLILLMSLPAPTLYLVTTYTNSSSMMT